MLPLEPPQVGPGSQERAALLKRALRLEYLTVGWNVIEGIVAVGAALRAGSVALLGFGADSFVESLSGLVLVSRFRAELGGAADGARVERIEHRARRLVGISLIALFILVTVDAGRTLWVRSKPETSFVGIAVTLASIGVMIWLARAKRRLAAKLDSRALQADAVQTSACWWLSITTLIGILLNAIFGWWWADPAAAFAITYFLVREGREAWRGDTCC